MAKILVVDDAIVDCHLARSLLEKSPDLTVSCATNGRDALAVMEREAPDVVVTDLLMPEMNGLELVESIRARYPLVPVILMTAHGSEEIAIQALQKGAASYVTKRRLAQDLQETVENVLAVATAQRGQQRILECLVQTEAHFILDNDPSLIPPLIGQLRENLVRMKLCDGTGLIRVTIALSEALTNAVHHGNLETGSELRDTDERLYHQLIERRRQEKPYRDRRIHVFARESTAEARYVIRDEGRGFDPSHLPDPTDPKNLDKASGRGLLLIRTFMDEVYNNDRGNEITMIKRRET